MENYGLICIAGYFETRGFRGLTSNLENLVPQKWNHCLLSVLKDLSTVGVWSFEPLLENKIHEMFSLSIHCMLDL